MVSIANLSFAILIAAATAVFVALIATGHTEPTAAAEKPAKIQAPVLAPQVVERSVAERTTASAPPAAILNAPPAPPPAELPALLLSPAHTPDAMLVYYRSITGAMDEMARQIADGRATPSTKYEHARLTAIAKHMERGQYYYIGPKDRAPKTPPNTTEIEWPKVYYEGHNVAMFALSSAEFPELLQNQLPVDTEPPRAVPNGITRTAREALLDKHRQPARR